MNARTAVEIGVAYGWLSHCLCSGIESVAGEDGVYIGVDTNCKFCESVDEIISGFNIQKNTCCCNSRDVDWVQELKMFDRTEIDIASIDGNHLGENPLLDLKSILPLMSDCGVILMHDYGNHYEDVVAAVNTILKEEKWRLFQLPQNKSTNETGCCILQRDQFLEAAPGKDDRPEHIIEYEGNISTKTESRSKLPQWSLKES
jgi:predicted O-methyltransferase YrrM